MILRRFLSLTSANKQAQKLSLFAFCETKEGEVSHEEENVPEAEEVQVETQ